MLVAATSDLHGHLPTIPDADVLLIAGDVGPHAKWYHRDLDKARRWLIEEFADWLVDAPCLVVGIAGNHDMIAQADPGLMYSLPWIYLCDESDEIYGHTIHGSPWSLTNPKWAFRDDDDMLAQYWEKIPKDTDILLTHSPPYGRGDVSLRGRHCGSQTLQRRVKDLSPKLHVWGHIHEANGYRDEYNDGVGANVSYVDRDRNPMQPISIFEIE